MLPYSDEAWSLEPNSCAVVVRPGRWVAANSHFETRIDDDVIKEHV